jgi:MoaA/NifB/PqqE/SkfB family radical SAM enzyme
MHTYKNQFPNIPCLLPPKGQIPKGYRLRARDWSFDESLYGQYVEIEGQKVRKMLTLDIDIPSDDFAYSVNRFEAGSDEANKAFYNYYPCPHNCFGCFDNTKVKNKILTWDEVVTHTILPAIKLGLRSIKFLGPGELIANSNLFTILDFFAERNIVVGIFTKGIILGSDYLAHKYHRMDSEELVRRIAAYPNTNFYVGGRSFDPELERRTVPARTNEIRQNVANHKCRNRALERLASLGMNADLFNQRMTIQCNPVTRENIDLVEEIYQWGAERNIPVYLPPTMVSGKGHREAGRLTEDIEFEEEYINLAARVYAWAINRGILTLEQVRYEGIHPYIAVAPCNQLVHGLYVNSEGRVQMCPGNDAPGFIVNPDVRTTPLWKIWTGSKNYRMGYDKRINNRCVKDGYSIPHRFYGEVLSRLESSLKQ